MSTHTNHKKPNTVNKNMALRVTAIGVGVALALVLSYVETLLPLSVAIPGVKLGLGNIVTIFMLFRLGWKDAIFVSVVRVALASLLFGNAVGAAYSVAGALLSLTGMILVSKTKKLSPVGISVTGGVLHNIGQIVMAILITDTTQIAAWLPALIISGVIAGIAVGAVGAILIKTISFRGFG